MRKKKQHPIYSTISSNILESFTVDGIRLTVEDRIHEAVPWRSERILWIEGTDAYYSVAPLCPAWHKLLCFQYCEEVAKEHEPAFYHHALALGCGGGAVPRWLLEEYPDLTVDVVDRSQKILDICQKYFVTVWKDSERLSLICSDAENYTKPAYDYQFIFCDLFGGMELAPVVSQKDFAEKLGTMLSEDGTLVINCGFDDLKEIKSVYRSFFEEVREIDREPWQTKVLRASGPREKSLEKVSHSS